MWNECLMNSGRGFFRSRFVVFVLALVALVLVGGCSSAENERSNNKFQRDVGQDVGQQDVQEPEDTREGDTSDVNLADVDNAGADADPGQDTTPLGCTDDAVRCSAEGNSEVCTDNAWQAQETCPFGCFGGECLEETACVSGTVRCNEHNVEICNAEGSAYMNVATCAVGCRSGLCTGACTAGETRCNGNQVETCNSTGSDWDITEECATFCSLTTHACALSALTISGDLILKADEFGGTLVVAGPLVVKSGMELHSETGELNIYAESIIVEEGATVSVAPTGQNPAGQGAAGRLLNCGNSSISSGGRGGSYGTQASSPSCSEPGQDSSVYGSDHDAFVEKGSPGGNNRLVHEYFKPGSGGLGGGVLRLFADTIQVAGTVSANGAPGWSGNQSNTGSGGGGSGGGILLAADSLTVTGTLETQGGLRGRNINRPMHEGSDGGTGRIKLLYGSQGDITDAVAENFVGAVTRGLLPPVELSSSTHPDPTLVYNDDFEVAIFAWEKPFPGVAGYHFKTSRTQYEVPTAADAYSAGESKVVQQELLASAGAHYFHITSVNEDAEVSAVESGFAIHINTLPPIVVSESNPDKSVWYDSPMATFSWTARNGDENVRNYYYVLDQYGDTVPTQGDEVLLASQTSLSLPAMSEGIWSLHLIAADTQGRGTKRATHYRVKIGEDPGQGSALGTIVDQHSAPVRGATVTVNRGLLLPETPDATSNAAGSYSLPALPAGSWELRISAPGYETKDVPVIVVKDQPLNVDVTLTKL